MGTKQPIIELVVFLTNNCNLKCRYCYAPDHNRQILSREKGEFAIQWFLKQAQSAKRPVTIAFYGGEPLLQTDLMRYLTEFAEDQTKDSDIHLRFGVTTNGTLLSENNINYMAQKDFQIILSIDGDQKTHDLLRRTTTNTGSFAAIDRSLPELLKQRPMTVARMTVNPETVSRLSANVEYLVSRGFRNLAIAPNIETDWNLEAWSYFDTECRKIANLYLQALTTDKKLNVTFLHDGLKRLLHGKRAIAACGAGKTLLAVGVNGDLYPCHRFAASFKYQGSYCVGNVVDGIDDQRLLPFRRYTNQQILGCYSPCEKCRGRAICGGGCLSKGHEYNQNFLMPLKTEQYVYCIWADIVQETLQFIQSNHPELLEGLFRKTSDKSCLY